MVFKYLFMHFYPVVVDDSKPKTLFDFSFMHFIRDASTSITIEHNAPLDYHFFVICKVLGLFNSYRLQQREA